MENEFSFIKNVFLLMKSYFSPLEIKFRKANFP